VEHRCWASLEPLVELDAYYIIGINSVMAEAPGWCVINYTLHNASGSSSATATVRVDPAVVDVDVVDELFGTDVEVVNVDVVDEASGTDVDVDVVDEVSDTDVVDVDVDVVDEVSGTDVEVVDVDEVKDVSGTEVVDVVDEVAGTVTDAVTAGDLLGGDAGHVVA
jgi:hypothetical protein